MSEKLTIDSLNMGMYIKNARNLFEDVCDSRAKHKTDTRIFTIMNYEKIAKDMFEFVDGYIKYKTKNNDKYKGKVAGSTVQFYNRMFTDDGYRRKCYLVDVSDIMKGFLTYTKKLQDIMADHIDETAIDSEMKTLFDLTNNQFRKVSKVNRDDLTLTLWLMHEGTFREDKYLPPVSLRVAYNDPKTPVMHLFQNK